MILPLKGRNNDDEIIIKLIGRHNDVVIANAIDNVQ
jgi:hypothetical protein